MVRSLRHEPLGSDGSRPITDHRRRKGAWPSSTGALRRGGRRDCIVAAKPKAERQSGVDCVTDAARGCGGRSVLLRPGRPLDWIGVGFGVGLNRSPATRSLYLDWMAPGVDLLRGAVRRRGAAAAGGAGGRGARAAGRLRRTGRASRPWPRRDRGRAHGDPAARPGGAARLPAPGPRMPDGPVCGYGPDASRPTWRASIRSTGRHGRASRRGRRSPPTCAICRGRCGGWNATAAPGRGDRLSPAPDPAGWARQRRIRGRAGAASRTGLRTSLPGAGARGALARPAAAFAAAVHRGGESAGAQALPAHGVPPPVPAALPRSTAAHRGGAVAERPRTSTLDKDLRFRY